MRFVSHFESFSVSLGDAMTRDSHDRDFLSAASENKKVRWSCACAHLLPLLLQLSFHCVCVNCVAWGTVCLCAWMMPASLIVQSAINSVKSAGAPMRNKFEYLWARAAKHTHTRSCRRKKRPKVGWLVRSLARLLRLPLLLLPRNVFRILMCRS